MKNIKARIQKTLALVSFSFICFWASIHFKISNEDQENSSRFVIGVQDWKHGIRHALWNQSFYRNDVSFLEYNEYWEEILSKLNLNKQDYGCNIIDIGANEGKINT